MKILCYLLATIISVSPFTLYGSEILAQLQARVEIVNGLVFVDLSNASENSVELEKFNLTERQSSIDLLVYSPQAKKILRPSYTAFVWKEHKMDIEPVRLESMKSIGVVARWKDIAALFDLSPGCYFLIARIEFESESKRSSVNSYPQRVCIE